MTHDFSVVFDTDNPLWQRVLDIFAKNEKYDKKVVKNRNLHHKFPRSFSKALGEEVDNDKDNLISLSLADHFLVHYYYYLLAKKGYRQSMALAFRLMARKGMKYITPETAEAMAKDYEEARDIANQHIALSHKGMHHSEETKRKIGAANSGPNNGMYQHEFTAEELECRRKSAAKSMQGKHHTEETRQKMSEAQRNSSRCIEWRTKLHELNKGRVPWNKGLPSCDKGKHRSEETKQKMREAALRREARKREEYDRLQ